MEELVGGLRLMQSENEFRLCTDTVLLSAFPALDKVRTACDLGCGAGQLSLLLAGRSEKLLIDAVELQEAACRLAERNVELNLLGKRVRVLRGDVRQIRTLLPLGKYDLVVCNPPYFMPDSGKTHACGSIAAARTLKDASLSDFCCAAGQLLRWGGRFAAVNRVEMLAEMLCSMRGAGIEPKRLRFVVHRSEKQPEIFLVEGTRGGKPGLKLLKELVIKNPDGSDTDELRAIYGQK